MRSDQEENAINRVLKARGLPGLTEPGVVEALAAIVEDHQHFTELLRACDPELRRQMYESMSPHLRFKALPLEDYIIRSKEHAAAAELPTLDEKGNLHQYYMPHVMTGTVTGIHLEVKDYELWVVCSRCPREGFFYGERKVDAIHAMRSAGWAYDSTTLAHHICPNCLDAIDAVDAPASKKAS